MEFFLATADFGLVFGGWMAAMYNNIWSPTKILGHLSEPYRIGSSARHVCAGSWPTTKENGYIPPEMDIFHPIDD